MEEIFKVYLGHLFNNKKEEELERQMIISKSQAEYESYRQLQHTQVNLIKFS